MVSMNVFDAIATVTRAAALQTSPALGDVPAQLRSGYGPAATKRCDSRAPVPPRFAVDSGKTRWLQDSPAPSRR